MKNSRFDYIFDQDYELLQAIQPCNGSQHHDVYRARNRKTGMLVCIKRINLLKLKNRSKNYQALQQDELAMLQ